MTDKQGPLELELEAKPSKPKRAGRKGANARKTVTFGDGSAVSGNMAWSVAAVIVLIILWYIVTRQWGMPGEFKELAKENDWNAVEIVRNCEDTEGCSFTEVLNDRTLPDPWNVLVAFKTLATEGFRNVSLWSHIYWSLRRVFMGLALGVVVGVPTGLAMGLSNTMRGIFDPIVELFRPVPPLAFIALVIVWFGIFEKSKVFILFFAALWIMIISSRSGVLSVKLSKVHAAYSLGASKFQILKNVILPNALPEILTGLRVSLGVCWGTLVAAEIVAAEQGLGAMTWTASKFLRMDVVVAGIILIGLMGFAMDILMRKLEDRLIPWRGKG